MNVFSKIFAPEGLVRPDRRLGELPTAKEAYQTSLKIALPALAEMIFVSLIGMVDTVMVSGLGTWAIAAVGITSQPRMIFLALFFALNVGVTAIVSRRRGENDREGANVCFSQSLLLTALLTIVMTIVAVTLATPMMQLAGAKPDTLEASADYFRILGAALPISALAMGINAAQRGIGNTKISLKTNLAANIVNVIFNYLLIEGRFGFPRLEVEGAAIATVIGNIVGLTIAISSLFKKDSYLSVKLLKFRPDFQMIKLLGKIGGNSVFEQICMRIGFFAYARIVADLGTADLAVHMIAMQMMNLTFTIGDGLSIASTTLVGQNLGKRRPDLSTMYGKIGQRLALSASLVMVAVILIARTPFAAAFSDDPTIIAKASSILIIMALLQPLQTSQVVMAGSLRGAGDTRFVAMTMLLTVAFCRPLFSLLFIHPLQLGLHGAWFAIIVDQALRLGLLYRRFSGGRWASIKI